MRRLILLLVLVATPAAAFEPTGNAVADGYLRILESGGFEEVAIEEARQGDGGIMMTGLTARSPARNEALQIARIVIVDGLIDGNNALRTKGIQYAGVRMTNTAASEAYSTADAITLGPTTLPMREGTGSWLATVLGEFRTIVVDGLAAHPADGRALAVARIEIMRGGDQTPASGRVAFRGATVDAAFLQGTASTVLSDLGYDRLTLNGTLEGKWDAQSGAARLNEVSLAAADLGALAVSGAATGITAERVATLQANMGALDQLLPVLQAIRVEALTIAFRDGGLTERLVRRASTRSGSSADVVRERAVQSIADVLGFLRSPQLRDQVADALGRFLAAPGVITMSVSPPETVTLAQLVGGALLKPDLLPQLLNLSIAVEP